MSVNSYPPREYWKSGFEYNNQINILDLFTQWFYRWVLRYQHRLCFINGKSGRKRIDCDGGDDGGIIKMKQVTVLRRSAWWSLCHSRRQSPLQSVRSPGYQCIMLLMMMVIIMMMMAKVMVIGIFLKSINLRSCRSLQFPALGPQSCTWDLYSNT